MSKSTTRIKTMNGQTNSKNKTMVFHKYSWGPGCVYFGRNQIVFWCLLFLIGIQVFPFLANAGEKGTVRAIVFYKQDSAECRLLLREVLPGFKKTFGDDLAILMINNGDPEGGNLYLTALLELNIPLTQTLPLLLIGDSIWSDMDSIKQKMPGAIEKAINSGGADWPLIPGLGELLKNIEKLDSEEQKNWWVGADISQFQYLLSGFAYKFNHDPKANKIAAVVLACLVSCLIASFYLFFRSPREKISNVYRIGIMILLAVGLFVGWQLAEVSSILQAKKVFPGSVEELLTFFIFGALLAAYIYSFRSLFKSSFQQMKIWQIRIVPVLSIIVIIAAGYLLYSELTGAEAQCGAVGDCNAVQQSPYSTLFGMISVAGLGITGVLVATVLWLMHYWGPLKWRALSGTGMWLALLIGVLFFIYLTFLEPFVIGATCFWCLSAAIAMSLEFYILSPVAGESWRKLRGSQTG
jgi:uncharacterized membrane protein